MIYLNEILREINLVQVSHPKKLKILLIKEIIQKKTFKEVKNII